MIGVMVVVGILGSALLFQFRYDRRKQLHRSLQVIGGDR
jgi:hypothetical protein